ncbi:MAG: AAA family ATPase, partial [Opitutales bacterium]|nr:AAA family ATPase [Opitutales bacterium]
AMTVAMCGFNAVSVPMGAHADSADGTANKANDWINNDFDFLNRFEKIRLCMDNDEVGKSAARSLFARLGVARTDLVEIPPSSGKDPNECFALEGADGLRDYILAAHGIVPEKLVSAKKYELPLRARLMREFSSEEGLEFPYSFGEHFKVRMGEVSIVTGYPGHGKTTALNDILIYYATRDNLLSCIASLEVSADRTLETLWRQACGRKRLVDQFGNEVEGLWSLSLDFLDRHFYFFDNVGMSRLTEVLTVFEYAARRYGVKLFCLDSLMCLDVGEDDYDKQKAVMSALVDFAAKFQCHVFVVCHPRKLGEKKVDSKYVPGPDDIAGSRNLKGLVHNIIVFHRNLNKPTAVYEAQLAQDAGRIDDAKAMYDEAVFIRKQREGTGELPYKYLWFDQASRQFRDKFDKPVRRSFGYGGTEEAGFDAEDYF